MAVAVAAAAAAAAAAGLAAGGESNSGSTHGGSMFHMPSAMAAQRMGISDGQGKAYCIHICSASQCLALLVAVIIMADCHCILAAAFVGFCDVSNGGLGDTPVGSASAADADASTIDVSAA
jgi:hypothetical protein